MPTFHAVSSRVIAAPSAKVYAIVADYRRGHARILPQGAFSNLQVEQGGVGAGTIITFETRIAGTTRHFRQEIREPEPGHILQEVDLTSDLVTTFTFTPRNAQETWVQIESKGATERGGILGNVEARITSAIMQRIFARELAQLATVVQE